MTAALWLIVVLLLLTLGTLGRVAKAVEEMTKAYAEWLKEQA